MEKTLKIKNAAAVARGVPGVGSFAPGASKDVPEKIARQLLRGKDWVEAHQPVAPARPASSEED